MCLSEELLLAVKLHGDSLQLTVLTTHHFWSTTSHSENIKSMSLYINVPTLRMNLSAPRTCCFDSRTSTISSLAVDRRWKHTELNDEVWNHALGYLMCVSVWYLQHVQWQLVGRRVRTLQRQKQTGLNTQTHTQRNANTHWTQSLSSQCDNKWCSSWVHQVSSLQIIYNHQEMKTVLSFFCVLLVMKTSNINKLNDLKVVSLSSQTVLYYNRNIKWTSPPVWS